MQDALHLRHVDGPDDPEVALGLGFVDVHGGGTTLEPLKVGGRKEALCEFLDDAADALTLGGDVPMGPQPRLDARVDVNPPIRRRILAWEVSVARRT